MKKLGLIVNPIAGMGGSVGLKGTDGVLEEALKRGSMPKASDKTRIALLQLRDIGEDLEIVTCKKDMGQSSIIDLDIKTRIVYCPVDKRTKSADTVEAAKKMLDERVDLILFAGGDGTARDIFRGTGGKAIVIGIPAGVKIHSAVFAQSPSKAGELAKLYLTGRTNLTNEAEVLDIDEAEYRKGNVFTKLYGYMPVPVERRFMQSKKAPSPLSEKSQQYDIAKAVIDEMVPGTYYIVGPGSTTRAIMELLGLEYTLIGIDIICNKRLLAKDLCEKQILSYIEERESKLIITPTGGQGYLLGRGNQQISPEVIRRIGKRNIIVIATKNKISDLKGNPFLIDTGCRETDIMLKGYVKVITGRMESVVYRVNV